MVKANITYDQLVYSLCSGKTYAMIYAYIDDKKHEYRQDFNQV